MADPFSVTGSAVGVVALGLEVCKGLAWYIGNVKGEKSEVSQISERLDKLADILENLTNILGKLKPVPGSVIDPSTILTSTDILACSNALDNIREKLQSSNNARQNQCFRDSVRYWKSRLSYPFRREDLIFLKKMVESVQQNLHTALLSLIL
ncbi:hypothetical protein K505DRAFT_248099 [Melanomma pulvis-pyrius CBS 109.77]|uniref:Fungal N-terminal domain-containing protein n=1 Tax=Melanomma pulvis-pyrius CBS 109.77 TaxID=1314802 RepID=A0A6A6X5L0_9PLEO|nr:hypothetical protein K505DRAFT_248099 [Melanomma pulvis-pyrius CBS 109.77]